VEVRQRWRERDPRRTAVASLMVPLSTSLAALLRPHHLVSYLSGCDFGEMNVLLSDGFMRDLEETRIDLGKIGRALQFIDATGLRPSSAKRIYPRAAGTIAHRSPTMIMAGLIRRLVFISSRPNPIGTTVIASPSRSYGAVIGIGPPCAATGAASTGSAQRSTCAAPMLMRRCCVPS
jgi:hypothetical protein